MIICSMSHHIATPYITSHRIPMTNHITSHHTTPCTFMTLCIIVTNRFSVNRGKKVRKSKELPNRDTIRQHNGRR